MAPWLRKISAFFFLLVFLYPTVAEAINTLEHLDDKHCVEHNVIHVENIEHHCFICDFVPAPVMKPSVCELVAITKHFTPRMVVANSSYYVITDYLSADLRGPPVDC